MEERIEDIAGNIDHFTSECDPHNLNYGRIVNILNRFEKEIRKDQDKITRHACAENINNSIETGNKIHTTHAIQIIMNTKMVK